MAHAPKETKDCAGRPKDPHKRSAILASARAQFLANGFERAGMDAIASGAGVSKLTVYSHFGSKEALFTQVIEAQCSALSLSGDYSDLLAMSPREGLMHIAQQFIALVFRPESINMHRIMLAEAGTKPMMSRLFYEAGPQPVKRSFAQYLAKMTEQKKLNVEEPERATHYFFNLLKGEPHFRALLNLGDMPTRPALDAHVKDVVEMFLRAYRAD